MSSSRSTHSRRDFSSRSSGAIWLGWQSTEVGAPGTEMLRSMAGGGRAAGAAGAAAGAVVGRSAGAAVAAVPGRETAWDRRCSSSCSSDR